MLIDGKIIEAIELANVIFFEDEGTLETLLLIESSYNRAVKQLQKGLILIPEFNLEEQRKRNSIQGIINDLSRSARQMQVLEYRTKKGEFMKWGVMPPGMEGNNNTTVTNVTGSVININSGYIPPVMQYNNYGDNIAGDKITVNSPKPKVESSVTVFVEMEETNSKLVDRIFAIMKRYRMLYLQWGIVFPVLAEEAKGISDDLLNAVDEIAFTHDLNRVDDVKNSLDAYEKGVGELIQRAAKEMNTAQNDEKNQILVLLKAEDKLAIPKWADFKKAHKVMEQVGVKMPIKFPELEPASDMSKRLLKNTMITAVKS